MMSTIGPQHVGPHYKASTRAGRYTTVLRKGCVDIAGIINYCRLQYFRPPTRIWRGDAFRHKHMFGRGPQFMVPRTGYVSSLSYFYHEIIQIKC